MVSKCFARAMHENSISPHAGLFTHRACRETKRERCGLERSRVRFGPGNGPVIAMIALDLGLVRGGGVGGGLAPSLLGWVH